MKKIFHSSKVPPVQDNRRTGTPGLISDSCHCRSGARLHDLIHPDKIYIGDGKARNTTFKLDAHVQLISNQDGILGGFMLWEPTQKGECE
jgi:hypothetical protein